MCARYTIRKKTLREVADALEAEYAIHSAFDSAQRPRRARARSHARTRERSMFSVPS
jgi:hypothetical protein